MNEKKISHHRKLRNSIGLTFPQVGRDTYTGYYISAHKMIIIHDV